MIFSLQNYLTQNDAEQMITHLVSQEQSLPLLQLSIVVGDVLMMLLSGRNGRVIPTH